MRNEELIKLKVRSANNFLVRTAHPTPTLLV